VDLKLFRDFLRKPSAFLHGSDTLSKPLIQELDLLLCGSLATRVFAGGSFFLAALDPKARLLELSGLLHSCFTVTRILELSIENLL
jgi:hypothetical protein